MPLSVVELETFQLQPTADSADLLVEHSRGETLKNDKHDPLGARAVFGAALASYQDLSPEARTNAVELAAARIMRDDGFAAQDLRVHSGQPPEDVPYPVNRLLDAQYMTERLLGLEPNKGVSSFGIDVEILEETARSNPDLSHLFAEHGATVSGVGRVAAWNMTIPGPMGLFSAPGHLKRRDGVLANYQTSSFGRDRAHGFIVLGNNGYYWTSNAMNGARVETAIGGVEHELRVLPWLRRAAEGLEFTRTHDKDNLLRAVLTAGRLSKDLRSSTAARRAIHNHY